MKTIYTYRLEDAQGNFSYTTVDDLVDNGCIGGYDAQDKYQQFDSYALYHAYEWAKEHGFKLACTAHVIDVEAMFKDCTYE